MKSRRTLLRELMALAASAGSLDTVYRSALRCVQEGLGIQRASLLLFDASGSMRFVAWSGLSDEYRQAVDGHSPWSRDESDATSIVVEDIAHEPSMRAYATIMHREGIHALAFIPLQFGAKLLGKFMLYYPEPHAFSLSEIAIAEQIADYVVFALEHHRMAVALEQQLISERELRRRAEHEAAQRVESESRLRVALSAGQMGAWDWDLRSDRVRWSDELERIHGLPSGAFGGTSAAVRELVHPLDIAQFDAALERARSRADHDYDLEYRVVRPDGTSRWLTCRGRLIDDAEGVPTRIVGVATDITDMKRLVETANEADRRKDDFLATLAHELRNPLAAVRVGVAVLTRAKGDPQTVVEYGAVMERQLRHLTRLVDDLLHVADIARGELPMEKSRVELSAVVRAALEQSGTLIEEAGHELAVDLPSEPVVLDADAERLVQVLVNLLSNAAKYMPAAGRIELSATTTANEVQLRVRDTGLGIPPDKLDSIFEMFGQLDRSSETGHRGLGIGLALSRSIVAMHGGRIRAFSEGVGMGSEFSVWLPLAAPVEATAPPPRPSPPAQITTTTTTTGTRRRVLLVDDNKDVASSMSRWLRLIGHDVRVALDGIEAIRIAEQFRPEVALLDLAMPNVSGYDVARTLRSASWGKDMTIVAVTGWGREDDQRRSADAGFDRHMTKPVDPLALEIFLESANRSAPTPSDVLRILH